MGNDRRFGGFLTQNGFGLQRLDTQRGSDEILVVKQLLPGGCLKLRLRRTDFVDACNLPGERVNRRCTDGPALDQNATGLGILRPERLDGSTGLAIA